MLSEGHWVRTRRAADQTGSADFLFWWVRNPSAAEGPHSRTVLLSLVTQTGPDEQHLSIRTICSQVTGL